MHAIVPTKIAIAICRGDARSSFAARHRLAMRVRILCQLRRMGEGTEDQKIRR
jgi:hypothetical protein